MESELSDIKEIPSARIEILTEMFSILKSSLIFDSSY